MSGLFDSDFKYSEFKPDFSGKRAKKGRLLGEAGADYPLWAKGGSRYWMAQPGLLQYHHRKGRDR